MVLIVNNFQITYNYTYFCKEYFRATVSSVSIHEQMANFLTSLIWCYIIQLYFMNTKVSFLIIHI